MGLKRTQKTPRRRPQKTTRRRTRKGAMKAGGRRRSEGRASEESESKRRRRKARRHPFSFKLQAVAHQRQPQGKRYVQLSKLTTMAATHKILNSEHYLFQIRSRELGTSKQEVERF